MPCPRVPRPMDGQRTQTTGRTVLLRGTERVQAPATRQDAQGVAPLAPHFGCVDWEWDAGDALAHVGCGGHIYNAGTNTPRRYCGTCGKEWIHKDERWQGIGR